MRLERTMNGQLFLAHADDHRPLLDEGLPVPSTFGAPVVDVAKLPVERLANLFAPPDDLREQRWAIVVPEGPAGERLLSLVQPLREKREQEQGGKAQVYEVPASMDQVAAANWIKKAYRDAVQRKEAARPRYLLLLGGPEDISWEFQQMLAEEAFVGRLAFDDDAGYEAYVEKAVRHADARDVPRAHALFHTVLDGTRATSEGDEHLVQPCIEMAREAMDEGRFDVETLRNTSMKSPTERLDLATGTNALLDVVGGARASLLFSVSHGAGVPPGGWASVAEQRALQGAMVLGKRQLLTANDVRNRPFLPMGVWFLFACYGAGTPSRSAYLPWVRELASCGMPTAVVHDLLRALPGPGEQPFVAALPQAALANPNGPLAIVGHVDLAWSWSFLEYELHDSGYRAMSRAERFQGILRAFVHGHRFGVAHHELVHFFRSLNGELTAMYDTDAQAMAPPLDSRGALRKKVRRANVWMQRNDLGAYVLLGDPGSRLPIARRPAGIRFASGVRDGVRVSDNLLQREQDVLAVLRGIESCEEIAMRRGVSRVEVERWVGGFCEGGRRGLAEELD